MTDDLPIRVVVHPDDGCCSVDHPELFGLGAATLTTSQWEQLQDAVKYDAAITPRALGLSWVPPHVDAP